jgi:heme/copper-type cytochrome/quinol oxidase subunit 3
MAASALNHRLRSPQAAGGAGIAFALILATVMLLLQGSGTTTSTTPQAWIRDEANRDRIQLALALVPFAGIAFLWFIGVIRYRLGDREDKLFATVFLGSGLLFVAMLFAAGSVMGSFLTLQGQPEGASDDVARLSGALTATLLATFGARMAAVFVAVVTTAGRRAGVIPPWLVGFGYLAALALFLVPPGVAWLQLLFPIWVLVLSLDILLRPANGAGPTTG